MDLEEFLNPSLSSQQEITVSLHTIWQWKDEGIEEMEDEFREIEDENDVKLSFDTRKQIFELKGQSHDELEKARVQLQRLLLARSCPPAAKPVYVVPAPRSKKPKRPAIEPPAIPPDFENARSWIPPSELVEEKQQEEEEDDDLDGLQHTFYFSDKVADPEAVLMRRDANQPVNSWKEICKELGVNGVLHLDKRPRMHITGSKKKSVEEAVKRIEVLETLHIRPRFKLRKFPLVHYPRPLKRFKLQFIRLYSHAFFSKVVLGAPKDCYILVPALENDNGEYKLTDFTTSQLIPIRQNGTSNQRKAETTKKQPIEVANENPKNWSTIPQVQQQQSWRREPPDLTEDAFPALGGNKPQPVRMTEEQQLTQKDWKKQRSAPKKAQPEGVNTDANIINTKVLINIEEKETQQASDLRPPIRNTVYGRDPYGGIGISPGKRLADYNLAQLKRAFWEGLEYVQMYKGEIRFSANLGKVVFVKVPPTPHVLHQLWQYQDLRDMLVDQHGVEPLLSNFFPIEAPAPDERLPALLTDTFLMKYTSRTSFFEINARARNSPYSDYSLVTMYVNMGYVSLEKVMLPWERLVEFDWTILDRRYDFSMHLSTRKQIRHDVKPFSTFIKKTSVSPNNRVLTFENIENYLEVKQVEAKEVYEFRLNDPFVAEITRVEKLRLDVKDNIKVTGKTGSGIVYYTYEIVNKTTRDVLLDNLTISEGATAKWNVADILGPEPDFNLLVEMVKTLLTMVERTHKYSLEYYSEPGNSLDS